MKKIDLSEVTIISVAGKNALDSLKAIKYSCKELQFGSVKLITPEIMTDDFVSIIQCENLNYEQYNHFIVYRLHEYIDTPFALIVQSDGYVVNPQSWKNEFLEYDYIGAVWPLPKDNFSYRDVLNNIQRVGNGGFSLRSKKLLSLAKNLNLEWKEYFGFHHEDGFFSCHNRHVYEQNGCKFAPVEIASFFSHENEVKENEGKIPFGFHGKNHYYYNKTKEKL